MCLDSIHTTHVLYAFTQSLHIWYDYLPSGFVVVAVVVFAALFTSDDVVWFGLLKGDN